MKKIFLFATAFLLLGNLHSQNNPGDTIVVPTFTFGSPQNAWFVFPSDTNRYEKVIMKYTLKCNPAQSPACGEWDYLTNTYVYKHTGLLDSSIVVQPNYVVNSSSPDSMQFSYSPTYTNDSSWQYFIVHTSMSSLTTDTIGSGTTISNAPFGTSQPVSRSQFLWKASELSAAGLTAGNISGLQFYLQSLGGSMRDLTIRIQHTTLDSLTQATFTNAGFTTVYSQNTQFSSTGWNSIQLTTPFNWNGTSNLLVEITYDNTPMFADNILQADTTVAFKSGLVNSGHDRAVTANAGGYVNVPLNSGVAALDSFITVSYWAYGSVAAQPQDGTCFEAIDSANERVINAHCPWSDANVYWDAGNTGGNYDRISHAAVASEYAGQWNYWTFTKNVGTGSMKIYLNGNLWFSGTGKVRRMRWIKYFRIEKGNWNGSNSYAGRMDEFTVLNKELSQAEIQSYMNNAITPSDPNFSNVVLQYNFDDGNNLTAADSASGNHAAATLFNVNDPLKNSSELTNHFTETKIRPRITFEQGVYTSHLDSVLVIDSTLNTSFQIVVYNDSVNNPGVATDTIVGWPVTGNATVDSTIYLSNYSYYNKFPQVIRYELGRYITPYGNGLSLGTGWTWTFDVSDYVTLLHDSVNLEAGNWQELLDVKFLMILGTPPRDVVDIKNLWNGNFNYGQPADPIESHLPPLQIPIPANAITSRWKSRVTGHGMDTPQNCAEFCPKNHYYYVGSNLEYTKLVWRDNCARNPLYPQGGTWVYERSNWCPGAEVWTYDMELTPFVTPGDTAVLNHDAEPYSNTGGWDYYQVEDQIVYYGAPNFTLDARLEDILSPSKDQMWLRYNPVCTSPVVRIRNTGSTPLTSLTITYGLNNGPMSTYTWTGNLAFMESADVTLGTFGWAQGASSFVCTISNPNGGADQYSYNNSRTSAFTYPPVMPSPFVIQYRSNNSYTEDSYTVKDDQGNIIFTRTASAPNTTYNDTMVLANGCYVFEMIDAGEDGLSWWANTAQGSGYLRFKSASSNAIYKNFGADFGGQVYQQFTVGLTSSIDENMFTTQDILNVYPNPTDGHLFIDVDLAQRSDGKIEVHDMLGKVVFEYNFTSSLAESKEVDLSQYGSGMYFVSLVSGNEVLTKKVVVQ
ncbi:MAG: T9SS type A sorting domain-containing protein [Bacteroidetes bacterium]|nr:T9SS type A sorting domain-containing protein [Bacteroidota bacterium]